MSLATRLAALERNLPPVLTLEERLRAVADFWEHVIPEVEEWLTHHGFASAEAAEAAGHTGTNHRPTVFADMRVFIAAVKEMRCDVEVEKSRRKRGKQGATEAASATPDAIDTVKHDAAVHVGLS